MPPFRVQRLLLDTGDEKLDVVDRMLKRCLSFSSPTDL